MTTTTSCLRLFTLACAGLLALGANVQPARAGQSGVGNFAVLPAGATGPEGITVGPDHNIYVAGSGFNASGPVSGSGKVYVFDRNGRFLRQLTIAGSTPELLGLDFHPTTHALLVIDEGGKQVFNVDPHTGSASVFMTVTGGAGVPWVSDPLLTTTGVPPYGANGLGFNKAGDTLFVANTGNDQIIKIPVSGGTPGTPSIFVNSINGADGLILDDRDNIWVAANQSDQIVVIDKTGKLITKFGGFGSIAPSGTPHGLLFPASLVFASKGNRGPEHSLYVTNFALDIRLFGLAQSPDSQWAAMVTRYTLSRFDAVLPH